MEYPENQSLYALTTRLGVSSSPSRVGSSPAHASRVRTASSATSRVTGPGTARGFALFVLAMALCFQKVSEESNVGHSPNAAVRLFRSAAGLSEAGAPCARPRSKAELPAPGPVCTGW